MTRLDFLAIIPQLPEIYVIYSSLTRAPYVSCEEEYFNKEINYFDEIIMYASQKAAIKKTEELAKADIPTIVIKVPQSQMLQLFSELFTLGIDGVRIHTADDVFFFLLSEIVNRPDYSDRPENERPLENAGVQLSMLYFMQEVRRKSADRSSKKLREMEEEMLANILRSKFLIPIREPKEGDTKGELLMVKMNDESMMVPIFSDGVVLTRFAAGKNLKAIVMEAQRLAEMPLPEAANGFLINPNGVAVPLKKDYLEKLMPGRGEK